MKKLYIGLVCLALSSSPQLHAAMEGGHTMEDDPLLAALFVQQLELRQDATETPLSWQAQAWLGKDLNKLWLKTEGDSNQGVVEEMEYQLLYSRAVSPFWDVQVGVRVNEFAAVQRNYLAISMQGLAPYFFDMDIGLFLDPDSGQSAFRVDAEYEMLFTQRLVLTPEIEINAYGQDDAASRLGTGLADISLGLRLGYEVRREFAPYIGVNLWQKFGATADFATADGGPTSGSQIVAGLRFWF